MPEQRLLSRPGFVIAVLWLVDLALLQADLMVLRGGDFGDWTTIIGALYHATVGMAIVAKVIALVIAVVGIYSLVSHARQGLTSFVSLTTAISALSLLPAFFVLRTPSYLASIELYFVTWSLTIVSVAVVVLEGINGAQAKI